MARNSPRCRLRSQLQSPLLRLPGEIRIKIYRYALIRDEPLDLWPHKWTKPCEEEKPSVGGLKVRHQESLEYVRKEMATGLLGTCCQIYNEAAALFWSDNLFNFSGRSGWQGFLRFYLTIGPQARGRIQRVGVHAPIYMRWPVKDADNKDLNGRSKNFPHMHMVKVDPEGRKSTLWNILFLKLIAFQIIKARRERVLFWKHALHLKRYFTERMLILKNGRPRQNCHPENLRSSNTGQSLERDQLHHPQGLPQR